MDFKDILKRYHISPLQYDDGTELNESDYNSLYIILSKYYAVNSYVGKRTPKLEDYSKKIENHCKRCLIEPDVDEVMDILMGQTGGTVL